MDRADAEPGERAPARPAPPRRVRAALAGYALAWRLAGPVIVRRATARLRRQGVAHPRARERAGWPTLMRPEGRLLWLHAASVGESLSVLPLVERLAAPGRTVLLTTGTASSAAILARRLPPHALHQFAPLDAPGAVARVLEHWSPDLLATVESEVWPNLLVAARARGVPLALVNARLSGRSLAAWERVPALARALLGHFDLVTAQTPEAAEALGRLGARAPEVSGNMKAAAGAPPADAAELARLRAEVAGRPLWAAASTHPGEEEAALDAHAALLHDRPDALLILVPRHPERAKEVRRLATSRGLAAARRSLGEPPGGAKVLLADTLGEMGLWVRLAPVVFLGGSLVPVGGHNPWEPAGAGAAVLTGPHRANALPDFAQLVDAGAAAEVADASAMARAVAALWDDPARLGAMREAARATAAAQVVAVEDLARDLLALLPATPPTLGFAAASAVDVIAPNLKRRYSGVTSTVLRLLPVQAREVAIAAAGPSLPATLPRLRPGDLLTMPRKGPSGPRVWHARRNVEMLAGLALRALGKRHRLLFTSAAQRRHSRYTRWLLRRMDAVVATSSRSAAFLEVPHRVILHGVDAALFTPAGDRAALRRSLGLDPDAFLVGCFGRLRAQKGTDLLVEALLATLPAHPDARAVLMGGVTPDQAGFVEGLKAKVAAAGLAHRIAFRPEDPAWDVARWFRALDLYATAPRVEGFGLTPLEAMACGVPVIASRAGAFEDIVADGVTGRLVPAGDGAALAQALGEALADRATVRRWAAAARAHVLARHRIEDEAAALNALYRELMS
jgi:3-deoxy-D-manno-octulosonic-acid transferase/glycosyltransferase involved in cell wall biosynthesis